ncbi:MAG TPA: hypothetical protein PK431_03310 [Chitinophagales bacterium]|nr:hypothetical protein [Chitinophagales bacterium]
MSSIDNPSNRIWNSVKKMSLISFKTNIDTTKSILDYNDKFIVWIVGFAITSITLIIANNTKLLNVTSSKSIKIVIIFLTISFFSGIICRLLSFILLRCLSDIMVYLEIALSTEYDFPDMDKDDIERVNNSTDYIYIIDQYIEAGGKIPENLISSYKNSTDSVKNDFLTKAKIAYSELIAYNKEHYDNAMNFVFDTYRKAYNISIDEFNTLMNNSNSITNKYYKLIDRKLIPFTFFLSCVTFLISLIIIIANYLIK